MVVALAVLTLLVAVAVVVAGVAIYLPMPRRRRELEALGKHLRWFESQANSSRSLRDLRRADVTLYLEFGLLPDHVAMSKDRRFLDQNLLLLHYQVPFLLLYEDAAVPKTVEVYYKVAARNEDAIRLELAAIRDVVFEERPVPEAITHVFRSGTLLDKFTLPGVDQLDWFEDNRKQQLKEQAS